MTRWIDSGARKEKRLTTVGSTGEACEHVSFRIYYSQVMWDGLGDASNSV